MSNAGLHVLMILLPQVPRDKPCLHSGAIDSFGEGWPNGYLTHSKWMALRSER